MPEGERRRREGNGTGRTSRGSSSSGREKTGRNIISNSSARVSHDGGGASMEDAGAPLVVDGLFSSKSRDSTGGSVELGGGGYNRRKTAPEPPPYHDDDGDTTVTREPQLPVSSSSFSVNGRSTAPASTVVVPEKNGNGGARRSAAGAGPGEVLEERAYLVTDTYPYTFKQVDREDEDRLLGLDASGLAYKKELPQMDDYSGKQLQLATGAATTLQDWDVECAGKHLEAIKDSVVTHDDLYTFTFMKGEEPVQVLDLAGLENAPGVFDDVTQRCRVAFTNKNRLVFTQAKHSAEVGMPKMRFPMSLLACLHDRWSRRKWSSFYAAINNSQILQVFVQQTLTTSYETSTCTFNDVLDLLCCPTGGTMYSEKDLNHSTQTLGDHDPGNCMSKWDKTRFMRHALVIRYVDTSSNTVMQTIAMAHPATPASNLFEMAGLIEASITITTAEWLLRKNLPTPLDPVPFNNNSPPPPLFQRKSYRGTIFLLFIVALSYFAVNTTAAVVMLLAVLASVIGSYTSSKKRRRETRKAVGLMGMLLGGSGGPSKTVIGTSGGGLVTYALFFLRNLPN